MTIVEMIKTLPEENTLKITRPNHNMHIYIDHEGILRDDDTQEPPVFTHMDLIADDWQLVD
jgi:hypothetical protein